ncbi:MAG: N-acetyltransferase [Chloroflexota bacterium]|nr:N-acetyltransferase [Chloroflexota bacterium]
MIRKATVRDVPAIVALVNETAQKGLVLPKSLNQVYQNLRDYVVCEEDGKLVACAALHVLWEDLAEVRSLVVHAQRRGKGMGRQLVATLVKQARDLGVPRVFALTYQQEFFLSLGFHLIDKDQLPHKIWADCIDCIKFPNCDETAVILDL